MGGHVAIHLAARRPDLVRSLVLVNSTGIPFEIAPGAHLANLIVPRGAMSFARILARDIFRAGPTAMTVAFTRLLRDDARPTMRRLTMPVLLLWGERDPLVPLTYARQMLEAIPNARLVVIPYAGHVPMWENPRAFNDALLAFFRTVESSGDSPFLSIILLDDLRLDRRHRPSRGGPRPRHRPHPWPRHVQLVFRSLRACVVRARLVTDRSRPAGLWRKQKRTVSRRCRACPDPRVVGRRDRHSQRDLGRTLSWLQRCGPPSTHPSRSTARHRLHRASLGPLHSVPALPTVADRRVPRAAGDLRLCRSRLLARRPGAMVRHVSSIRKRSAERTAVSGANDRRAGRSASRSTPDHESALRPWRARVPLFVSAGDCGEHRAWPRGERTAPRPCPR